MPYTDQVQQIAATIHPSVIVTKTHKGLVAHIKDTAHEMLVDPIKVAKKDWKAIGGDIHGFVSKSNLKPVGQIDSKPKPPAPSTPPSRPNVM
jgi:hypothetical protein